MTKQPVCPREWTHRPGTYCSTCERLIPGEQTKSPPFSKPKKEKR